ncbi:MAG: hypothetical protein ABIF40_04880 [archaeon]
MLTIEEVVRLCADENIEACLHKKSHPLKLKGKLDVPYGLGQVNVYAPEVESQQDYDFTVLHEFVHARDEYILGIVNRDDNEVENEALQTYEEAPEVLMIIKQLYPNLNRRF